MIQRTLNIGLHRNSHRLWIEGALLKDAGFLRGDKYIIQERNYKGCWIIRVLNPDGSYKERGIDVAMPGEIIKRGIISGRERRGKEILIIDCHTKEFALGPIVVTSCPLSVTLAQGGQA